jgi:hypothetical protein
LDEVKVAPVDVVGDYNSRLAMRERRGIRNYDSGAVYSEERKKGKDLASGRGRQDVNYEGMIEWHTETCKDKLYSQPHGLGDMGREVVDERGREQGQREK